MIYPRKTLSFFAAIFMFFGSAGLLLGQSTTDGALDGTVSDQHKAVVPKAEVTAINMDTNQEKTASTDGSGRFRVVQLRPGPYRVTVKGAGFASYTRENILVEVGRITPLEIALVVVGGKETVEVNDTAPVIDTTRQDFATNVNQTSINELPINGRRWSNFALLTPGATPDGNFGLISFRGISGLLNNNTVDGGDNNQAFFSEERGRTRLSYVVSQASISEFQVNTSNYSAEYGRAAGGVVNAVTKSGTNQLHGSAFYYIRDNALGATNPFSFQSTLVGGVAQSVHIKPDDRRHQFGATVGGPIVKDKAFFFFSYDQQKRNFPAVSAPGDPNFFNLSTTQQATLTNRGVTNTQRDAGIALLQSFTGLAPRTGDQYIILPKLDWNLNPKNTFTASYNRLRWSSPSGVQTAAVVANGRASFGDDFVNVDSLNLRLTSTLASTLVNEARYQWGRDNEFQLSQPPLPGEPTSAPGGKSPQIEVNPNGGGFTFGKPNFLDRRALPDEKRNQFSDALTLTRGRHTFKFGGEYNHVNDIEDNLFQESGNYTYSTLEDFLSDFANPAGKNYNEFDQGFGPSKFQFSTSDIAFFIQDDWRVVPRLTVNAGLRYEYEALPSPQFPNALAPQTASYPSDKNNLGPRVGFAWDVFGDGKTALRGGYGVYYGRIINSTIANAITNTGLATGQAQLALSPGDPGSPVFPNLLSAGGQPSSDIVVFSRSAVNPLIQQADLVIEREIARNTVISVSYLLSLGRGLPTFVDTNLKPTTATTTYSVSGGPLNGQTFTVPFYPRAAGRANPTFGRIMEIQSAVHSRYDAVVVQGSRRLTNGLQFQTSYTFSKSLDTGQASQTFTARSALLLDPFNQELEYGLSNFDIRHRFVASVVWSPEYFKGQDHAVAHALLDGYTISPIVTASSGVPVTGLVSGSAPGGISSGILGAGGSSRPPFVGRNAFNAPRITDVDMRISRRFKVKERANLELLAEAFNLFNHTNFTAVNTNLYNIPRNQRMLVFNPKFLTPTQAGNTNFRERQIQFAARFTF